MLPALYTRVPRVLTGIGIEGTYTDSAQLPLHGTNASKPFVFN